MSKNWIDCVELSLENSNAQVKSLWMKIIYYTNKRNILFCVYYRPPDQEEEVDEEFFLQLWEESCPQALILIWAFSPRTSAGKAT